MTLSPLSAPVGRQPMAANATSGGHDSASADGGWGVQVGVYPRRAAALVTAKDAFAKAPAPLAQGTIKVVPLKGRRGPLYRARILGLDKERAYSACRALKAEKTPCMVLRMTDADREQQAAAASRLLKRVAVLRVRIGSALVVDCRRMRGSARFVGLFGYVDLEKRVRVGSPLAGDPRHCQRDAGRALG